jgi:cytoskeletal protein RodZ
MKSDRVSIVLAFGIILALLSVNAVWATPEQSPDRQTVPTRTPKVPTSVPTKEKDTPVPAPPKEKDRPTPVPPTMTTTPTAQALASSTPANSPQTLPRAGASLPPMAWLSLVILGGMALATGMILARTKE